MFPKVSSDLLLFKKNSLIPEIILVSEFSEDKEMPFRIIVNLEKVILRFLQILRKRRARLRNICRFLQYSFKNNKIMSI